MPRGVYVRTNEYREKQRVAHLGRPNPHSPTPSGPARSDWRGEEATYSSKHKWVVRHRGPARDQACEHCGEPASEWANVSREYRRELDDYMALCRPCHRRYDKKAVEL